MTRFAGLLLAALALVSCSEASEVAVPPGPAPAEAESRPDETSGEGPGSTETSAGETPTGPEASPGAETGDQAEHEAGEDPGGGHEGGHDTEGGDAGAAGGGDGDNAFNDSGSEDDHSSAVYPAAGLYVYGQQGYERFCQGTSCERRALPPRQRIDVSLRNQSPQRATVVTEIEASDNRLVRTRAVYTRANALVTDVYARFGYEGFTFENTYRPDPPVESLRFPLRAGTAWSGRWEADTSGSYSIEVIGSEGVTVGGASLQAIKISSVMDLRGQFEGTAKSLIWLDPATKAVVKTTGKLDLTSAFGRYLTEFSTKLRSGPGY